jgi:hypothetical protein
VSSSQESYGDDEDKPEVNYENLSSDEEEYESGEFLEYIK